MALPPTEANMLLHLKRVHLQVMLWKAADRQGPPILDITKFGWDRKSGLPSSSLDNDPAAPDGLIDVISSGFQRMLFMYTHARTYARTHYVTIKIRLKFVTVTVRFAVSHRISFAILDIGDLA